jgi:hypothetical protein
MENGPVCGECEECKRRNQGIVPADFWASARLNVLVRTLWAVGSSKPEEIHC